VRTLNRDEVMKVRSNWVIVRTLWVSERSLYLMCSVILSQWRERRMGVI